jgi:hypothetical protein
LLASVSTLEEAIEVLYLDGTIGHEVDMVASLLG